MPPSHDSFGVLLKQLREASGLTQEAAAEKAGVSARAIGALERGVNRTPRRDTLERLAAPPLAIELAAARTKVLPPAELLRRLKRRLHVLTGGPRDLPARQRTMRDAIGWSYELLGASEQSVLQQLSVCVGGCTLDAAEAIVRRAPRDGAIASDDLLESVAVLVDHSLVRVREDSGAEPRLSMLEIVREYGLDRLAASGESTPARERHAVYYLNYAELASARLMGPGQSGGLEQLDLELGNLRAVLEWAAERDAHELGLRTATALAPYWFFRGYFAEGRAWIDRWLTGALRQQ